MSPRSSRYPRPASGDDVTATGRHRRPETLADVTGEQPVIRRAEPAPAAATPTRRARHARTRPQGGHRAPTAPPVKALLRVGHKRQQVLLASLVALGLLLVAIPAQQRRDGVSAVNAAAQRAMGVHTDAKSADKPVTRKRKPVGEPVATSATPSAPVTKPAQTASATPSAEPKGMGPALSLRMTGTKAIALTFDDGPDPVQTPKILALLAQYHLKATFCLVGTQVAKHPEIVRQIVAAGHSLCDHTWNHSLTIGKDKPEQIKADLEKTNAAIQAAAPGAPIPYFRAPGGNFTDALVKVATAEGMTSLYWEVDPRDWDHPEGETDEAHIAKVITAVKNHVRPGSIILSHDFGQPDTIAAYQQLLPWLTANYTIGLPAEPLPAGTSPTATADPSPSATATATPTVTTTPGEVQVAATAQG